MSVAAAPLRGVDDMSRWASALLVISLVAVFSVSPMALGAMGVNYDSVGGAMWQKLHPATYTAALALAVHISGQRRPLAYIRALPARFPGATFFFVIWILLIAYAALVQHLPITALIETYLIAVVALIMHDDLTTGSRAFIRVFLHVILFVNSTIGVFEFVTHLRLFPYVLSGEEVTGDYRSTALLGHPLLNAATTGAYVLCLFFGADAALAPLARVLLIGVQILGLAAFGGRTAIMMCTLIISGGLLKDFGLLLMGRRFDLRRLLLFIFITPVVLGAIGYAVSAGVFDDLIGRFVDDNGSAEARVIMVKMFDAFDVADLMLGPNPDLVSSTQRSLGIAVGIENTWVALMFQYGALMTAFFICGLLALFWEFWRQARRGAIFLFLYFFVIISSAIGLAAKTTMFIEFAILLLFMFNDEFKDSGDA